MVVVQEKPVNAYLPLFWAFIILCMLAGLRLTYQAIYKTSAFRLGTWAVEGVLRDVKPNQSSIFYIPPPLFVEIYRANFEK